MVVARGRRALLGGVLRIAGADLGARDFQALRESLRARGHVDGRDIVIDCRSAEGRPEALPGLAAEIAALRPAVIVAPGLVLVEAVRAAAPGYRSLR